MTLDETYREPDENEEGDPVDRAFAAYLRASDSGDLCSREEFLAQFPEISDQLKELMDAADVIGQATLSSFGIDPLDGPATIASQHAVSQLKNANHDSESIVHDSSAETLVGVGMVDDGSDANSGATLPMANRAEGDPGPTLPYQLGDYLLLEVIGRGGMGVVYKAKQQELDRHVAVKMIRNGMLASEAEVRRFYTEAQAAARLHHPGIVSVFQFGRRAGHHFFSMECITGTDLQRKINNGQLDINTAVKYVRDVARAIDHAHEKGVLHRDLKPANVLIDEKDQIHVTDFGLAKHLDCDSSVTASGDALGTPHYMAPEQAGGHSDRATCHSDVYSLGAILYAALTGRPPLVGDTVMQTLVKVMHDPVPPVRSLRREVPTDVETVIAKCLEKKPAKRYASAAKLADELDAYLEGRPIEARPRSAAMKTWHWIEGVPLVGALMGRRILHSSQSHRRFQTAVLLCLVLIPLVMLGKYALQISHADAMPSHIHIAGGITEGRYNDLSQEIARRLESNYEIATKVSPSRGSLDNHDQLTAGHIDLAPMQATAIRGDHLRVVAPLFYEVLHVLAHVDTSIKHIDDLSGHRVAVGPAGSGSHATAELVLESLNIDTSTIERESGRWEQLFAANPPDAAMICIGPGSVLVSRLLQTGNWRIIPIYQGVQMSLRHPTLRPMMILADHLPQPSAALKDIPREDIPSVGTTAFLAARDDAPSDLVLGALKVLYTDPLPSADLIPRRRAAEWQGLAFHRAARRYYRDAAP